MAKLTENANQADPSPLSYRALPSPLNCKNEYLVLALGMETAVQAVVGSHLRILQGQKVKGLGDKC